MAKRRKKSRRPPPQRNERLRLTNTEPEADDEDRAAVLALLPSWARLLRTRSGYVAGAALVGGIILYSVLGSVAGAVASAILLIGVGLAMWRADALERRARAERARP